MRNQVLVGSMEDDLSVADELSMKTGSLALEDFIVISLYLITLKTKQQITMKWNSIRY